jgi:16S rRNA (uracil1498-N3)-methyltransferase
MRISRIYTGQPLDPDQEVTLEQMASRHLVQVLRLRPGADLVLFNGDGCNYAARLESTSNKQAVAQVISCSDPELQPELEIHLCICVSKGERMDFAIQKSVELGVTEITPLFSKHGVVQLQGERLEKRQQHWRQIMISACEQSGRCRLPRINPCSGIEQWLESPRQGVSLTFNHRANTKITEIERPHNRVNILVGPEGGLSESEIHAAETSGFQGVRMGPRVLRTETAPLAAIAVIQTLWGDFS